MESQIITPCAALECLVVLFQGFGIMALCMVRLLPRTRWSEVGRYLFLSAMLGLGCAGAICGRMDSRFALFAGVTMTLLMIGMIAGNGSIDLNSANGRVARSSSRLVG